MVDIKLTHTFLSDVHKDTYKEHRLHYILVHPFATLWYLLHKIKWFWQRATKGWAECDAWNADAYLAKIIADISTFILGENFTDSRKELKPYDVIMFNALHDIAYGFDSYTAYLTELGCTAKLSKETQEALDLFKEYFSSLHINN